MHLEAVRARIAEACRRAGRDPRDVGIVAVTKSHPVSAVAEAVEAGLSDVGENKVQEALGKQDQWQGPPVRWHLIGHLQRNKAKQVVGRFALIHSVDSVRLADALEQAAAASRLTQDVLVQVNVAGESQKAGARPDEAGALVAYVQSRPHLALKGFMTMAPLTDDVSIQRETFNGLRELRDLLEMAAGVSVPGIRFPVLSMGMSGDFEIAVEEGATLVRLGTVLYGERQP